MVRCRCNADPRGDQRRRGVPDHGDHGHRAGQQVHFIDPEDEAAEVSFRDRWEEWHPNVPLITLRSAHRSIAPPIVEYLSQLVAENQYHSLVVLIPEVQPRRLWDNVMFNQRGAILDRAIRRGAANVVLCRLRYRLEQFAPDDAGAGPVGDPSAAPRVTAPPPG